MAQTTCNKCCQTSHKQPDVIENAAKSVAMEEEEWAQKHH